MTSDLNDLAYWFPKLRAGAPNIPVPATRIVEAPEGLFGFVDGDVDADQIEGVNRFFGEIHAAADEVGWPAFLRTGHGSDKHGWKNTCFLGAPADIPHHVGALVEWSLMVDIMGLPFETWVVREMLPTRPLFHAFDGMPIVREARFFVDNGEVIGWQPYWPAIDVFSWGATPGFAEQVDALHEFTDGELYELTQLTEQAGLAVPGAWSVDWLDVNGSWFLTDMAIASQSFVWTDWPTAPQDLAGQS